LVLRVHNSKPSLAQNLYSKLFVFSESHLAHTSPAHPPAHSTRQHQEEEEEEKDFVRVIPTDRKTLEQVAAEEEGPIRLSCVDVAAGITLKESNLVATGRLGYRSVLATKGVSEGSFYYEVKVVGRLYKVHGVDP
jgi:hypothetical protein